MGEKEAKKKILTDLEKQADKQEIAVLKKTIETNKLEKDVEKEKKKDPMKYSKTLENVMDEQNKDALRKKINKLEKKSDAEVHEEKRAKKLRHDKKHQHT